MTTKPAERKVRLPPPLISSGKDQSAQLTMLHQSLVELAEAHNQHDDTINRALRGGISMANNSLAKYQDLAIIMPAQPPWLPLPTIAPWMALGVTGIVTPQYLMLPGGRVQTRGLIVSGVPGSAAAQLPLAGYMPVFDDEVAIVCDDNLGSLTGAAMLIDPPSSSLFVMGIGTIFSLNASWFAEPAASPHAFPSPWPIIVQHGFTKCLGLDVVGCREESQTAKGPVGAPVPDWEDIGNGQLRLNGVWGLQWGKKYTMRVRLSAEQ